METKEFHKTTFWESLQIQKRVIGALLMREIITRYGRANIDYDHVDCFDVEICSRR